MKCRFSNYFSHDRTVRASIFHVFLLPKTPIYIYIYIYECAAPVLSSKFPVRTVDAIFCEGLPEYPDSEHDSEADAVFYEYETSGETFVWHPPELVHFFQYFSFDKVDTLLESHDYNEFVSHAIHLNAETNWQHLLFSLGDLLALCNTFPLSLAQTLSAAQLPSAQTLSAATEVPEHLVPATSLAAPSGYTVAVAGSPLPHNATPYNSFNSNVTSIYLKYLYKSAWYHIIESSLSQGL